MANQFFYEVNKVSHATYTWEEYFSLRCAAKWMDADEGTKYGVITGKKIKWLVRKGYLKTTNKIVNNYHYIVVKKNGKKLICGFKGRIC